MVGERVPLTRPWGLRGNSNREGEILKPQRQAGICLKIERRYKEAIDGLLCISEACDGRAPDSPTAVVGKSAKNGSNAGDEVTMRQCKRGQQFRRGVTGISRSCGQNRRAQKYAASRTGRSFGDWGLLKR